MLYYKQQHTVLDYLNTTKVEYKYNCREVAQKDVLWGYIKGLVLIITLYISPD